MGRGLAGVRRLLWFGALLLICVPVRAAEAAASAAQADLPPPGDRLGWWRGARLGLFIHWGPASVNGTEISWSRKGHPFDHPGMETVPPYDYDHLYQRFNPVKFDADRWMRVAKQAGMKYVVFITKHHDGFSMWPTQLRPEYSIRATPYQRDLCRQIADAAHRHGLRLGWYYSTRDWTHPDYLKDGNTRYNDFYHGQIRELLSNYGKVDVLWFDHVAGNWGDYRFGELYRMIYDLQPNILINDRAARFIRATQDHPTPEMQAMVRGDFDTPEQRVGKFQLERPWESCVTLTECKDGGGWSYRPDGRTRTGQECVRLLVNCATGDGNLLLNVGPLPTGEIAEAQVESLQWMGRWLRRYGRTIYGTRGGPLVNGAWGGSTCRGNQVFLHVLHWEGDTLRLPPIPQAITRCRTLTGGAAQVNSTAAGLTLTLPISQQDAVDTIIELDLAPKER